VRRRADGSAPPVPPVWLLDYRVWCAGRGLAPFGVGGDAASLRAAVVRWRTWCDEREAWAAEHGISEDELEMVGPAPFDPDL
jgi:hypothetical protein